MPVERGRWLFRTALRKLVFIAAKAVLLAAGFAAFAGAQSAVDGAIAGRVISAQGDAVQGAEIVLKGEDGEQRTATSGRHGEFLIVRLIPGSYRLIARAPGYSGTIEETVEAELGRTTEVQLGHAALAHGGSQTKLKRGLILLPRAARKKGLAPLATTTAKAARPVKASPPGQTILARDDPGATVVVAGDLNGLPVAGRDWRALALKTAGVHADPDADGQTLLTVRGLASTQNSSQIDGVSHDQSFGSIPVGTGGGTGRDAEDDAEQGGAVLSGGSSGQGIGSGRHAGAAFTFSQSAVREFRLNGGNYSALYGHAAGGVMTAVSKSGTNTLHGTAFLTIRESRWGAANPFSIQTSYADGVVTSGIVKPHDLREQFGGTLGGGVVRDRLFYFAVYDAQRRGFPAISSPANPAFYTLTPTQLALLGNRGVSRTKVNTALNYLSSLTGMVPRRQDQTVFFGKLDGRVSARNHVSIQYNRAHWTSPGGGTTAAVVARGRASLGNNDGSVDEGMARWTALLGKGFSNEVRLLYGRDFQYQTAQAPLPQEPAIGPGGYAPEISIAPLGLLFGTPASLGRKAYPDEHRIQVSEMLGWVHGRHYVRVGGDLSMVHDLVDALSNQDGTFHYDSGITGGHAGGLVDWITDYTFDVHAYPNGGCPSINAAVHDFCFRSFSQSFGQQTTSFDTQEWSGFVQDDWRLRTGLSVNFGVRYEYELLPLPQTPNPALDAIFGQTASTSVFPEDRNNAGPRIGISWQPFGSQATVIHAGYGLYFGRLPGTAIRSALVDSALPASTTHVRIVPGTETLCPQVANQGFGYACTYLTTPPAAVGTTTSAAVFDRRFRLPVVQQASLSIEHTAGAGIVASASYRINLDRQLPNSVDLNIAPSTTQELFQIRGGTGALGVRNSETFAVPLYTSRISTSFGPVTDIISNVNGSYNGLIFEARRASRHGLELRASYTWSKAIDDGQTSGGTPRTNGQFDPFQLRYDKGLSSLNFPHRVVASALWSPTIRTGTHWVRAAANGWEASPMFVESSGRPYSYDIFGGTRLKGGHESINGSGGATYLPTVGRNTLRLPDAWRLNLRISRSLQLTDRFNLRGVAEVFNVANHVNYSGVSQRAFLVQPAVGGVKPLVFQDAATIAAEGLNVQPFGTFTAAGTSEARERQLQLGLKLEF